VRSTSSPSPWLIVAIPAGLIAVLIGLLLAFAVVAGGASGCGESEAVGALGSEVPKRLVPIYEKAAATYGLGEEGPSVLAAINFVETDFGANMGPSSAGAEGWMQFLPSTWESVGVDGDEDGDKDSSDPWDAIFTAAHYLQVSGAPKDWHAAVFSYNHADWYVAEVLRDAKKFASPGGATVATAAGGCEAAALAPNEAVAEMIAEAGRLSAMRPRTSYVWGGSHTETPTPANGPFDCSSAVSHLLQVGGFPNPTMDTVALHTWGEPGPGKWVSIYVKPFGGEAHTFIKFTSGVTPASERYWGTSGQWFKGHGPGWIPERIFSAGYLGEFEIRHPLGL
jgi:Transglycosylase SLT domain